MRLRFGCDAKRESLCEIIDDPLLKTWFPLSVAAELDGYHPPDAGPYSFGARKTTLRQAGTLRGMEAVWGRTHLHVAFWDKAAEQLTAERRSQKDACHTPLNFDRVLQ